MSALAEQTVLVTGPTGFLGGALVRRLSADGVSVRALARRPERARAIQALPGVTVVQGDIRREADMQAAVEGCSVVFHVAAALGGTYDAQYATNVEGTQTVADAAAGAGVARFVHVSTISVYGYRNFENVTEETLPDPGADPYHSTKLAAEHTVRAVSRLHGLPYTIVRPSMIYGPGSNTWTAGMFQLARLNPVPLVGGGDGSAYPIYVDDVVDLLVTVATHPAALGETFNCTPDPSPTWREFLGAYARLAGHQNFIRVPVDPLLPLAQRVARLPGTGSSQFGDLPDLLPFLQRYITYKMDKARDLLGWQPQVSLEDGVARCAPYLRQKGLLR